MLEYFFIHLWFQPNSPDKGTPLNSSDGRNTSTLQLISNFKIGKLVRPKFFPWSLAAGIPLFEGKNIPLLGSWTAFRKSTSEKEKNQSLIKYLPACMQRLSWILGGNHAYSWYKWNFVHKDKQVYSRICQCIWKEKEKFQTGIVPLINGRLPPTLCLSINSST